MSLMQPLQPDDPGMNAALKIADYIHRDLTDAHASVWVYCFAIFTSSFQGSMGVLSPADGAQGALVVPKRFWAMANYSRFVRPGWKMIQIDGMGFDNTGFVSPDGGSFVVVAVNAGLNPQPVNYDFGGRTIGAVKAFATTANLDLGEVSPPTAAPHGFGATLAARSVTAFVGTLAQ
jgi:O-glycosyl hydrolase